MIEIAAPGPVDGLRDGGCGKGRGSGEEPVERGPKAEQVTARLGALAIAPCDFGGEKADRPARSLDALFPRVANAGHAEINEPRAAVLIDENVPRSNVTMDDSPAMSESDHACDVGHEPGRVSPVRAGGAASSPVLATVVGGPLDGGRRLVLVGGNAAPANARNAET